MSNCTNCSEELIPNAKFCKFCGTSQAEVAQSISDTPVVAKLKLAPACKKCNNELIPNSKFCKICGTKVSNEPVEAITISKAPKTASINPKQTSKKIEPHAVGTEVRNQSISSAEINNKKTGITGIQIAIGFTALILLVVFIFVTKSKEDTATTKPQAEVAQEVPVAPSVTAPVEVDAYAEEARSKLAEEVAQKKAADDEEKRIAEEEKAATIADAKEQKRVEHEDKLLLLQQQREEKIKKVEEAKKAKEVIALANRNAPTVGVANENKTNGSEEFDFRVPLFTDKTLCNSFNGYKVDIAISKDGVIILTKNASNAITNLQGKVDFSSIKEQKTSDKYYSVNGAVGSSNLKVYANNKGIFRVEILLNGNVSEVITCG